MTTIDKQHFKSLFFNEETGAYDSRKWRNAKHVERELELLPGDSLAEKVWNVFHERPKCACGNLTNWKKNYNLGYFPTCSASCGQASIAEDKRERHTRYWSDPEWKKDTANKMCKTHFDKRSQKKLLALQEKGITPVGEITPGCDNIFQWRHECGEVFEKSFRRVHAIWCPVCHVSRGQGEMFLYIRSVVPAGTTIIVNDRKPLAPKEIDVYLPELKLGFEFNGKYWHEGDGSRERLKTELAADVGIRLIHVEELDWKKKRKEQEQMIYDAIVSS